MTSTLLIIPAFNEAEALPGVLAELDELDLDHDVVVVDDGSTDGTAEAARAGGATVLELPFNLGIGGALRAGFLYAVRNSYDRAVQFDANRGTFHRNFLVVPLPGRSQVPTMRGGHAVG